MIHGHGTTPLSPARFYTVWALLILGSLLVWAAVCVAVVYAINQRTDTPIYRFCDGHLTQVAAVIPCPNNELRMIA